MQQNYRQSHHYIWVKHSDKFIVNLRRYKVKVSKKITCEIIIFNFKGLVSAVTSAGVIIGGTVVAFSDDKDTKPKGSFLLKTSKERSEAATIAAAAAVTAGDSIRTIGGKNEEVGRALIDLREKYMGPNVSVFYKQVFFNASG